ncbi:MAG: phosphoserine phosphatase SerB [Pseudomonadota bacterium]
MYVTVLLSNPAAPALSQSTVESLCDAWAGRDLRWLSEGEAAEFAMDRVPDVRWQVWDDLQAMGIDMAVVPADGRRKRMLLADMDSTMIDQECIDELAEVAGIGDRVKDITARAMDGQLDFEGALTERVALLAGLDAGVIDAVYRDRITLASGGATLLATITASGGHGALVSGGFTAFTTKVAADLGFHEHRANRLKIADGKLTGDVDRPILGREAKVTALTEITARLGISPEAVIAVGDGANDLGMLHAAGLGVALHAKPSVAAQCDVRINHGDLTALLYLQGYPKAAFKS